MCNMNFKKTCYFKLLISIFTCLLLVSCSGTNTDVDGNGQEHNMDNSSADETDMDTESYTLTVTDEGEDIFYSSQGYYRYGPSIMEYEDGSMDAWFSSPGNSGSEWDWIRYRHSDDGINWGDEQIVLKPTPGSKDQCSVCDPGVIYFDGYYYLAYTSTDYYEGEGSNNSAFVARSQYPDGPFEKWNGSGWGGAPEPMIKYEGDPSGFGIGEVSFVIVGEDLYIYYSYFDLHGGVLSLSKADLCENWPATIRFKGDTLIRENQDSLDIVYDETLDRFFGFSVDLRMTVSSRIIMYVSENGKEFVEADSTKTNIEDYAHNIGIAKSPEGHIDSSKEILVGYGYGENWGRWNLKMQHIEISQN